jgi:cholesterol transport system auxiliary component
MKTARRNSFVRVMTAILAITLVSGCTLLSPANLDTKKEMLDQMPAGLPQRETHAATLLVLPPETKPVYDTTQMAYTTRPYQINYFGYHEWGATPSEMLQPLLVKTLENTRYFSAVLTPPYSGSYTYLLRTEILELTQDFTSEPAVLQLSLRFQLNDGAANRVIATREISLHEPMQQKTPYAGVVAANNALAKALQELAGFVLEKVK